MITKEEDQRRRLARRNTKTDGEAAKMLGMPLRSYVSWRRAVKLPPRCKVGRPNWNKCESD